ncbi:hypothetical protein TNCV_1814151 [Trichonephila clavipes]|nr:hypothetical protein TNCV_1814151 [Trichonephila clavipes]
MADYEQLLQSSSIYPAHHRKLVSLLSAAPYWWIPIAAEDPELAKNGHQHDRRKCHQVVNLVAKNDTNSALSPRFRQVPIESPL